MELHYFEVVDSGDGAKRDHELHCTRCREYLCDVEPGDKLDALIGVADNHTCSRAAWLAKAVREALEMIGPTITVTEWWQHERARLESHTFGSVGAQARIDKEHNRPTDDEIREKLREILAEDHGVAASTCPHCSESVFSGHDHLVVGDFGEYWSCLKAMGR